VAEVDVREPSVRRDRSVKLPLPHEADWAWQLQGSCRDHSVETFFPDSVRGQAWIEAVNLAKRICRSCPVIEDCRDFAVKTQERWGIWGALTPAERLSENLR
jgi:WhiB family redox-sensing transcriptional regulator